MEIVKGFDLIMLPTIGKEIHPNQGIFEGLLKGIGRSELNNLLGQIVLNKKPGIGYVIDMWEPQHLYILSDNKIVTKDFFIHNNIIKRCDYIIGKDNDYSIYVSDKEHFSFQCKKIIASTDKSLKLPLISNVFLRSFINFYNENKKTPVSISLEMEDQFTENSETYIDANNSQGNYFTHSKKIKSIQIIS